MIVLQASKESIKGMLVIVTFKSCDLNIKLQINTLSGETIMNFKKLEDLGVKKVKGPVKILLRQA